ncbi:hypothetical protein RC54_15200 [Herbaspirillum rubrisubalbicans]|uniref:DUF6538 domain-containing protein n=2 Tax=Herbaspirillum rubrisubalbicans TaxID=80842 RepID=A0AAD0UDU3_9BURK|nr:hypothetical protein RC54_15200 [Herbaspirillum rubrisubalbicans]
MAGTKHRKQLEALHTERAPMPPNLKKSKTGIYTYRKVLPADVRHVFENKSEIKRSLGDNREQAMLAYHRIEAEIGQKIESARQQAESEKNFEAHLQKPRSQRQPVRIKGDTPNLGASIAKWTMDAMAAEMQARREGTFDDYEDVNKQIETNVPIINKALATGKVKPWRSQIELWLAGKGYYLDATEAQVQTLTIEYLRLLKKAYEVLALRQQGEDVEFEVILPEGPLLRPVWEPKEVYVAPLSSQPRSPKLSDVIPLYEKHLSIVQRKTRTTRLSWWRRLVDFCDDKPIQEVTKTDIYAFFETRLKASGDDNWTMDTNSKVKREFIFVFSLADAHGITNENPASALRAMPQISAEDEKKRRKPRYPFTDEKLNTIFASEWYDPDSEKMRGRMKWDLAARYWIPLICLHHGLRVREATQIGILTFLFVQQQTR